MTRARKRYGRPTEPIVVICSVLVLVFCSVLLAWFGREAVRHVSADTQPATVVSVDSHPNPFQKRGRHREQSVSFELADGSVHSSSVRKRLLWHPSEGDQVHVYEHSAGRWSISEEFSWTSTLLWSLALLTPWLLLALKVAETLRPTPARDSNARRSRPRRRR